jgi:hypothetical protein
VGGNDNDEWIDRFDEASNKDEVNRTIRQDRKVSGRAAKATLTA